MLLLAWPAPPIFSPLFCTNSISCVPAAPRCCWSTTPTLRTVTLGRTTARAGTTWRSSQTWVLQWGRLVDAASFAAKILYCTLQQSTIPCSPAAWLFSTVASLSPPLPLPTSCAKTLRCFALGCSGSPGVCAGVILGLPAAARLSLCPQRPAWSWIVAGFMRSWSEGAARGLAVAQSGRWTIPVLGSFWGMLIRMCCSKGCRRYPRLWTSGPPRTQILGLARFIEVYCAVITLHLQSCIPTARALQMSCILECEKLWSVL